MNINGINKNRAAITEFNGLKIRNNAGNSEFVDMENIDSHEYPYFSTRRKNYYLNKGAYGIGNQNVSDDMHGWCAYDTDFYYAIKLGDNFQIEKLAKDGNVYVVIDNATMTSKSAISSDTNWKNYNRIMVVMGGDIVIYPDWVKYNIKTGSTISLNKKITLDPNAIDETTKYIYLFASTENGDEYAHYESGHTMELTYGAYTSSDTGYFHSGEAQTRAKSSDRYYFEFKGEGDAKEGKIYKYYNSTSMWMSQDDYTTLAIHYRLLGYNSLDACRQGFKEKEIELGKEINLPINVSGISHTFEGKLNGDLNLFKVVIDGYYVEFIFKGVNVWNTTFSVRGEPQTANIYEVLQQSRYDVTTSYSQDNLMDLEIKNVLYNDLDFIVQEGNRLFACSSNKHEIYASKLGDPSIWKQFIGISTDSYAATIGSPGKFTGAAVFNNTPIFFKENCIHRVTGNTPASYNISYDYYDGIKDGCSNSIVRVGNYLIYYSKGGFVYYTGNQPERIDRQLGDKRFKNIFAGEKEGHYIAAVVEQETNKTYLLDYDMDLNQWYKHQDYNPRTFRIINVSNDLYTFHKELCDDDLQHTFITCIGRNLNESPYATAEDDFKWYAESGWLIKENTNKKYITKMLFKMHLDPDAEISISFKYDYNDEWEEVRTISNTDDYPKTEIISIIPQRCETMQYKIEGKGNVIIYSITYDISEGSEY